MLTLYRGVRARSRRPLPGSSGPEGDVPHLRLSGARQRDFEAKDGAYDPELTEDVLKL